MTTKKNIQETGDKYTLKENNCTCHPETCNCLKYMIYCDNKEYVPIQNKLRGEHIVACLNFFEKEIIDKYPGKKRLEEGLKEIFEGIL